MARFEQDREDILREATALVERTEWSVPTLPDPVVVGFRRDGSPSIYFGSEPVLQFNSQGELRRAYDQGRLLKAERGRLVAMRRERKERQVVLHSHELSETELQEFLKRMLHLLATVRDAVQRGTARVTRQVPSESHVAGRARNWLETRCDSLTIASRPGV
jgi:hypothetical protein